MKEQINILNQKLPIVKMCRIMAVLLIAILHSLTCKAQAPQIISWQSVLRNSMGNISANQSISLRFSIREGSSTGTIVYSEMQNATTNNAGWLHLNFGEGTPLTGTLPGVDWSSGNKFMQVEIDTAGVSVFLDMGTEQFTAVPYALYANNGVHAGTAAGQMLYWNGSSYSNTGTPTDRQVMKIINGVPTWSTAPMRITTTAVTSITSTTAPISGGFIANEGGSAIIMRGVCYATSPNPTLNDAHTSNGAGTGTFSSTMLGLNANTSYYLRAYATNDTDTAYGNEVVFTTIISIGNYYQGGKIAYILQPGNPGYVAGQVHGLIVPPNDLGSALWGCNGITIGGTSSAFGTGQANTNAIFYGCSELSFAAKLCNDYVSGGYGDWYMPSYQELVSMIPYKNIIGSFTSAAYICSTEESSNNVSIVLFCDGCGTGSITTKLAYQPVIAVRSF